MESSSANKELYSNSSLRTPPLGDGGKDPELWELARRRSSFKNHFATYLIVSVFFWLLWYFTGGPYYSNDIPWPVWPMLGWGIGVAFHYLAAYVRPKNNPVEREYEKLMKQKQNNQQ